MSSFRKQSEVKQPLWRICWTKFEKKGRSRICDIERAPTESHFEYKLRLCLAKLNREFDLDWQEIADILGENVSGDTLRKMAYGYKEYDGYLHDENVAANRILAISDTHVPFNLPVDTWKSYAGKVDTLVLNGDIQDAQSISKFSKQYRVPFIEELIAARFFIQDLAELIKPKKIVIVKGNHEARLSRYLSDRLNDDVLTIMPDTPMDLVINDGFKNRDRRYRTEVWYEPLKDVLGEEGIEVEYTGNWWAKIGKAIFVHPLSYSSGMLKTAEKALEYFLRLDRDFTTLVMAHTHKLGSYSQSGIQLYEQGCCCDTAKLNYNDGHMNLPAQKGYLYLCQDTNGEEIKNKTKLVTL